MDVNRWIHDVEHKRPSSPQSINPQDIRDDFAHPAWQCGSFPLTYDERVLLLFRWASRQLDTINANQCASRDDLLAFAETLIEYGQDCLPDAHNEMEGRLCDGEGTMIVCQEHDPANAERRRGRTIRSTVAETMRGHHRFADIVTSDTHQSTSQDSVDSIDTCRPSTTTEVQHPSLPVIRTLACSYSSTQEGTSHTRPEVHEDMSRSIPISSFHSTATMAFMAALRRADSALTSTSVARRSTSSSGSCESDQLCDSSSSDTAGTESDNTVTVPSPRLFPPHPSPSIVPTPLTTRSLNVESCPPLASVCNGAALKRAFEHESLPFRSNPVPKKSKR
ncbi:hypothetical protein A4X06_0g6363 [Tilletia controversa]|uniref:Uncharacterized protein n=1 Tax=Tilletia controversa TaxID=13291 RepID=A0A8X7MNS8_9BASI|nr:hypothetical protein A4X06_0g6363 [Tilletia controversa]